MRLCKNWSAGLRPGSFSLLVSMVLAALVAQAQAGGIEGSLTNRLNPITDLVLIYDGGVTKRLPWTMDRLRPYVYREENGEFEWLFDGFLFLDRFAKSGTRLCPISNRKDATQRDWAGLMDYYFEEGHSISALDQLLEELAAKGHQPLRKRRVVIALPTPITGSTPDKIEVSSDWGALNGRNLNFTNAADRFEAARWYVDEVIARWHQKNYQHLELAGFYWLFERAWGVHHTAEISQYIHAKGLGFYWIPSWPNGRTNWLHYGFDFVYQQPNYFFHRVPTPTNRLELACSFAEAAGTSMEMEFNRDLLAKPVFLGYFDEYLQAYTQHGIWEQKPVAYYEGEGAWFDMAQGADPAVKRRYEALADIIVQRQKRADAGYGFRQGRIKTEK